MNTQEKIVAFVKAKNIKKNIQNIRSLVKTGENTWSFMYTFIDGDYLSISKVYIVRINEKTGKVSYIRRKTVKKEKQKVYA